MISIKSSAIPKSLKPQTVLLLMIAHQIYTELGLDLEVTSLNDSKHMENSYHYSGNAFDSRIRSESWPSAKYPNAEQCAEILATAKARLNKCFDVVLEGDHFHWEYNARENGDV